MCLGRDQQKPLPLVKLCVLLIGLFGPVGLVVHLIVRQIHEGRTSEID